MRYHLLFCGYARSIAFGVTVLCYCILPSSVAHAGDGGTPDPELQRVLKLYQSRRDQLNPLLVKYRITTTESVEWQIYMNKRTGSKPNRAPTSPLERVDVGEYARKGDKVWAKVTHEHLNHLPVADDWTKEDFTLFDGQYMIAKSSTPNEYQISRRFQGPWPIQLPLDYTRENSILHSLERWVGGSMPLSGKVAQSVDNGRPMLIAKVNNPQTKWSDVWTLSSPDLVIRRYESFDPGKKLMSRVEITEYADLNGVPFPMKASKLYNLGGGVLGATSEYETISVEADPAKIPDRLFQFEFPANSVVFDTDLKVVVRRSEITESHLNDAVRQLAPPSLWRRWWAVALVAGALSATCFVVVRWLRRRRTPPVMPT